MILNIRLLPKSSKNLIKKEKKYYLFRDPLDRGLVCAFNRRAMGNMSLVYGDTANSLNNRKDFLSNLGIDYHDLVCIKQVGGSQIRFVKEQARGKGALSCDNSIADTDAIVTDKKRLPLAVFTADCLSIFLYDPKTPSIGLIHAGWRGTKENITAKTIQLMKVRFNTQTQDLYVGLGPAIRGCCYEVDKEFKNLFPADIIPRDGHYYLDLVQINKREILNSGVKNTNISDSNICTSCQNQEFFSYRKEGNSCGRAMSVIMLT